MKNTINSPQVIAALITGIITLSVTIVPFIFNNNSPEPTPTNTSVPIAATTMPTEADSVIDETVATNTSPPEPTITIAPTESLPANILLLYDDVSFTIYNQSSQSLSLSDLRFQSATGNWEANQWGTGLAENLPANNCLRMRDTASGERQPPSICGNLLGFQLVGGSALFWLNTDSFEVVLSDTVIATCSSIEESCPIFIP